MMKRDTICSVCFFFVKPNWCKMFQNPNETREVFSLQTVDSSRTNPGKQLGRYKAL